jgi:ubiquitin C-terminal hydrolase
VEMKCDKCKIQSTARVQKKIVSLPRVLVLHIKRFLVNPILDEYEKKRDKVMPNPVIYAGMLCV